MSNNNTIELAPGAARLSHWMFESSPDCVKVLDLEGRVLAMNRNGRCAMEVDDFELLRGRAWDSLWPQAERDTVRAAVAAARGGRAGHFQAFCPTVKGTPKWWDVSVTPILDEQGRVERLLSVSRDGTALQQAREEWRDAAARLEFTLDAAELGAWDLDLLTGTVRRTARHDRCFGHAEPLAEWRAETFIRHVHPDDRARVQRTISAAMAGQQQDLQLACRVVWPDGSVHWICAHGAIQRAPGGEPTRLLGIVRDITARRRAEALAEGQRRVLELAVTGAPLHEILALLCHSVEEQSDGQVLASVLLLSKDGRQLKCDAAPSLPAGFSAAIDGVEIGPSVGSCGTAAFLGRPVIVRDIASDPLWRDYRELAAAHGLRACWSYPILSSRGGVLGTLAAYCRKVREPSAEECAAMSLLVNTAALVLDRRREGEERRAVEVALRASEERFRALVTATSAIVWTTPPSGDFETPQPDWSAFTGQDEPALAGRGWLDAVHPEDRAGTWEAWQQALRSGSPYRTEHRLRRVDGLYRHMSVSAVPLRGPDGQVREWAGLHTDVTARKQAELHFRELATHDTLTGLPNRGYLNEHLQAILDSTPRDDARAVMLIDLDRFKQVNDSMGHEAGDALLREVARRLKSAMRGGDLVARLGGDEFVVVAHCDRGRQSARVIGERLLQALEAPIAIGGAEVFAGASIGIGMYPEHGRTREELFQHADIAMYRAKRAGGASLRFFVEEMSVEAKNRMRLELSLRGALDNGEFVLHYQPRLDLHTLRPVGMEALIRWQHPELGMVSPLEFIPIAEESGLIGALGLWVLRRACTDAQALGTQLGCPLRVSVNLSARQLKSAQLVAQVREVLAESGLDAGLLELELTESAFIDDMDASAQTLRGLKALGVRLAVDDFGTGYSGISYLRRFPIDTVKLDRTFVTQPTEGVSRDRFIRAITDMAHALNLVVVAEGVEDAATLRLLQQAACDEVQGYLFARPLPLQDASVYLVERLGLARGR